MTVCKVEDHTFLPNCKEESDGLQEVEQSGDSNISSSSDDDKVLYPFTSKI